MEETRRSERFTVALAAAFKDGGGAARQTCKIIELSRDGIRLLLSRKIKSGEKIMLEFLIPGRSASLHIPVTLRWHKQLYDASGFEYLAGGELVEIDPDEGSLLFSYMLTCAKA